MTRTVLITGVARGIGAAVARLFRAAGWRVLGIDKEEPAAWEGDSADHSRADLGEADAFEAALNGMASRVERLDCLVNNAAVQLCKPIGEIKTEEWDTSMAVNLRSIYLAVRVLKPYLAGGGSIVNVSSVHAVATSVNMSSYVAAKGGVAAMTRALALELAPEGIRVNAVLPGAVDTPMLREGLSRDQFAGSMEERRNVLERRTPLGRVGRPEEVAQAILFLADDARSSFITGSSLVVDGGALARLGTE